MMHQHPCAEVRDRLEAYHDGELPLDEQVAIQNHLNECVGCALAVAELDELSFALRRLSAGVSERASNDAQHVVASVMERLGVEHQLSFVAQVRGLFQDMHLVWAGLGATIATTVCLVGSMSVLHAASQERPDSLAGVISYLANPGSNANPMTFGVSTEMMAPRSRPDAVFEMSQEEAVVALAAVVTREGRVINIEVLSTGPGKIRRVRPDIIGAMLNEASQTQFEPAVARDGRPIAVNMVWLLTNTTVKGDADVMVIPPRPWRAPRLEPLPVPLAPSSAPPAVTPARSPSEPSNIG